MKTTLVQDSFSLRCLDGRVTDSIKIEKEKMLVGSQETCDLILSDRSVSKLHAFICVRGEGILIKDLCSDAGVFLQGKRIEEGYAYPGDTITIGTLSFTLEGGEVKGPVARDNKKTEVPSFFELPSKEGLIFIDGEYCDIVFNDSASNLVSKVPSFELGEGFIDLDHMEAAVEIAHPTKGKKLEIIGYVNGLMMEVLYLDLKDGDYYLSSEKKSSFDIPFLSSDRLKIFSIRQGNLQFFESNLVSPSTSWNEVNLEEAFFLSSGIEQVSFRLVEKTFQWKGLPAFYRDRDFLKVGPKAFLSVFLPILFLLFITIPDKREEVSEVAVVYKLPEKVSKVSEADKSSEVKAQELTSKSENSGHKENDQKNVKVEFASASMVKKVEAKAQAPSAASAKAASTPVKAYEFQSSVEVSSLVGDAPEINTKGIGVKGGASDSVFNTGSKESGELVAGSDIGVSKFNGSDKKGSGSASYGSRGLATKSGFDSSYLEPKTVVLGSMDPELLRKILREYIPQFRHCYQQELIGHSDKVKGIIDLNFTISSGGKVSKFQIRAKDAQFSQKGVGCMGQVLSLIDFPKPKGGGVVDVKQPLNFFSETEKI